MDQVLLFIVHNFPLSALAFACMLAIIKRKDLLCYLMLWPIGIGGIWEFYIHTFQTELGAELTGWHACNFQFVMAAAFLGLGINGLIAFVGQREFQLAVIIFSSALFWGDLVTHFYQYYYMGSPAQSNALMIMYADVLIPSSLWIAFTFDL